jgi:hypothetical protein
MPKVSEEIKYVIMLKISYNQDRVMFKEGVRKRIKSRKTAF